MKTNHISNIRPVGDDYFFLYYNTTRHNINTLDFWLKKFNINNYYIYKKTGKQRLINIDEFIDFKYSGYMFFRKDLYKIENIDIWIDYFNNFGGIQYLNKMTPPFPPNKIIIKK